MPAQSQGRLQDRKPISIIDIGSNSIRLVVYEGIARSPTVLFNEKMLAGLGRGIVSTGKLDPEGVTRAVEEFRRFRALSDQAGAGAPHVIATAAAREAVNGPDFIHRAENILGTGIRVLSGREEAYYSALGVVSGFHPAQGVAGDLGGGSLELVDINGEAIGDGITLPLGGLRLQDMAKNSLTAAARIARDELTRAKLLKGGEGRVFYAVGGTWRNLARLHMNVTDYPLAVMHHYEMDIEGSLGFLRQVAKGDVDKIKGIEGVSKNRRALLPYGATVLLEIIAAMKPSKLVVSAFGVREGFLYSLLPPQEQRADPLISCSGGTGAAARPIGQPLARTRGLDRILVRRLRHRRERGRGALSQGGVSPGRYRMARPPGISRHTIAQHHRACFLHRCRPPRPRLPGTDQLFPPRGRLQRVECCRDRQTGDTALSGTGTPSRRDDARRLPVVGVDAGRDPKLRWEARAGGGLALVVPKALGNLTGERPAGRLAQLARVMERKLDLVVGTE